MPAQGSGDQQIRRRVPGRRYLCGCEICRPSGRKFGKLNAFWQTVQLRLTPTCSRTLARRQTMGRVHRPSAGILRGDTNLWAFDRLDAGGHLTHAATSPIPNARANGSTHPVYGVRKEDNLQSTMIRVESASAKRTKQKMIIAGAPPSRARSISRACVCENRRYWSVPTARRHGAFAGSGLQRRKHPSPFPPCHMATTQHTKTLRGPARRT